MEVADHNASADRAAPETRGNVIRWGHRYDAVVKLLTLGKDRAIREVTADLAQIEPGSSVLDVGCGTGELTLVARARAGASSTVCGIDASPEMIEAAQTKTRGRSVEIDFRVGLIEALPFADDSFDIALSSLMMHHLPDDVKQQGLRELYRVLKPGGRLLIVDIRRATSLHQHFSIMTLVHPHLKAGVQDLPNMMKAAGFSHVESGGTGVFPMLGFVRGEVSRQGAT